MTGARLWAIFGFGALALQFPLLAMADEAGLTTPYLFIVWLLLILGAALAGRSAE